jgi:hypothetical protein
MTDSIALGVNELSIPPGTHICAFFRGVTERDQIIVPFLREGLRTQNKCMCIIDDEVDGCAAHSTKTAPYLPMPNVNNSISGPRKRHISGEARSRPKRC